MFFICGVVTVVKADDALLPEFLNLPPMLQGQSLPCVWGGGLLKDGAGIAWTILHLNFTAFV